MTTLTRSLALPTLFALASLTLAAGCLVDVAPDLADADTTTSGPGDTGKSDGGDTGSQPDTTTPEDGQAETELKCTPGDHAACDDGDGCTVDTCADSGVCAHEQRADVCKIGGLCYADGEELDVNKCKICDVKADAAGWTDRVCDDGEACTKDACDYEVGCVAPPDDTLPCDDGDACTTDDHCDGGQCVATPCPCHVDGDCGEAKVGPCERSVCVDNTCKATSDASKDGQGVCLSC